MLRRFLAALVLPLVAALTPLFASADVAPAQIGIVIMHGKGGSPTRYVAELAAGLQAQGFLVANLEMPWSGRRDYDVSVDEAETELVAALDALRDKGAQKLFIAGHSQGGLFALYIGTRRVLDGVIAIAPGGNAAGPAFREKLGDAVDRARTLVGAGKGVEKARLADFEGAKGTSIVITAPITYLTWFDPEGAMNQTKAVQGMKPEVPVLYIAPTEDYPALVKVNPQMFAALPANPRTRLYQPNSSHLNAPSASIKEIAQWTTAVANGR